MQAHEILTGPLEAMARRLHPRSGGRSGDSVPQESCGVTLWACLCLDLKVHM